jgi:L-cysteine/cystine lyase
VGAIPVDANGLDFLTISGQKWLCGPDATGGLVVADPERLRVARPSYFSQSTYEPSGSFEPAAGAARFDSGWIPPASLAGFLTALALPPDWHFEQAERQARRCRELLEPHVELVPGGATLVAFRADDPPALVARLMEADVAVRDIPGTGLVRVSCGWWTNEEDLARLAAAL